LINESKIDEITEEFTKISQDLKSLHSVADARISSLTSAIDSVKPIVEAYEKKKKSVDRTEKSESSSVDNTPSRKSARKNVGKDSSNVRSSRNDPRSKIYKHLETK